MENSVPFYFPDYLAVTFSKIRFNSQIELVDIVSGGFAHCINKHRNQRNDSNHTPKSVAKHCESSRGNRQEDVTDILLVIIYVITSAAPVPFICATREMYLLDLIIYIGLSTSHIPGSCNMEGDYLSRWILNRDIPFALHSLPSHLLCYWKLTSLSLSVIPETWTDFSFRRCCLTWWVFSAFSAFAPELPVVCRHDYEYWNISSIWC